VCGAVQHNIFGERTAPKVVSQSQSQ